MKITRKKKYLLIISTVLLLGILSYVFFFNTAPQPITITVKKGNIEEKVIAVGTIEPKHSISVKSTISGIVSQLYHEEGDYVEQGVLLLQVMPSPTPESVAEAYANVQENLAIVQHADEHKKRIEKLVKMQVDTPDNYSVAVKDLATAKARLEMAQEKLALLQKGETTIGGQSIKTTIPSPISGYILQRNVDIGDPVVPLTEAQAGTVLFVIANMHDFVFKGTVNEIDVTKIAPHMSADISIAALPDTKIRGTLNRISLRANNENNPENNSTNNNDSPFNVGFNVELNELQLAKNIRLRSGYSATAEITVKHADNALIVPERVLIFKDKKTYVNLLTEQKTILQEVKIGISDGIHVQILSGLTAGQLVLDDPHAAG
jgi:HlyD family secretion protein